MRLIFVDTETTGLAPGGGHRIVEIACVEMIDGCLTGREFHSRVNPQRPVPAAVTAIHGLDDALLRDQPVFAGIAAHLVRFVADGRVIIHNAPFDLAFLAAEFDRLGGCPPQSLTSRAHVTDSLPRFRQLHPAAPCSLEKLCLRYGLQPEPGEDWHGALTDARMLARLWQVAGLQS